MKELHIKKHHRVRIALLLGIMFLALGLLGACGDSKGGAKTAEEAFTGFFEAMQEGDVEAMQSYLASPAACPPLMNATKAQGKTIAALVSRASYAPPTVAEFDAGQLKEEDAPAKSAGAIVQINISNKNFLKVETMVSNAITADLSTFAAKKEGEKQKFLQESIEQAMENVSETTETAVSLLITNVDGVWKIQDAEQLAEVLFGNGALLDL